MARGYRPLSHRSGNVVQLCLVCLLCGAVSHRSFVLGVVTWGGHWAAKKQVTQRFSRQREELPKELPGEDLEVEARIFTSRMKESRSPEELIDILDEAVDCPIFNFIHASAAYTKLAALKKRLQPTDWDGPVIARLHARVKEMVLQDQLGSWETANVLHKLAKLSDRFSIPTQLAVDLAKSLPSKVNGMIPHALAYCLWACAQLKDRVPDVVEAVSAIVTQIPNKAKKMNPQQVSNSLWALAQLKDAVSDLSEIVRAVVVQIPANVQDMDPQGLSNCLLAALQLKDVAPVVLDHVPTLVAEIRSKINDSRMVPQALANSLEALVLLGGSAPQLARSAAERLTTLLPKIRGRDLTFAVPVIVWACAKVGVYNRHLMASVAERFLGSAHRTSSLPGFGVCALSWSYDVLDTEDEFKDFRKLLSSKVASQGFSQADVESCRLGRFQWNRATF